MRRITRTIIAVLSLPLIACSAYAGAELARPFIQVEQQERAAILERLGKYAEMREAYTAFKARVDEQIEEHRKDPAALLDRIPAFGRNRHGHLRVLELATDFGALYFLTGDEAYAQPAADLLNAYAQGIQKMPPDKISICENSFFMDSRTAWRPLGVIYDLIASFLQKPGITVYDREAKAQVAYRNEDIQAVFRRLARYGLNEWSADSNHPLLEATGILHSILAVDDKAERDAMVDEFVKGNKRSYGGPDYFFASLAKNAPARQPLDTMGNGLLWARDTLLENGGHWPESVGYGGFDGSILSWMDTIDRLYPHYKVFEGSEPIFLSFLSKELFVYPNRTEKVGYGDSGRSIGAGGDFNAGAYRQRIRIARRVGFKEIEQNLTALFKGALETHTGVARVPAPGPNRAILGYDRMDLNEVESRVLDFQTAEIAYAGVVVQKNEHLENKATHGLMCYTGGAHYVHNHLSGLDLELYGAGVVMSPVGGKGAAGGRGGDIFRNYYRIYAGHNTVIINGASRGREEGSWKSDGMLYMDTTHTEAMEPASMSPAISKAFTFSSQRLDDTVNNAVQQRIVSIVRTGPKSGYYLDLFRSASNDRNLFSDYIYKNLGDAFTLTNPAGEPLALAPQIGRYVSYPARGVNAWGRHYTVDFPGWHFFENVQVSAPVAVAVHGTFTLAGKDKYMHVAMPGGIEREYTAAKAPPGLETAAGYGKKNTRVLAIRQTDESWKRPYIVAFEPSTSDKSTIQSIENITDGDRIIGAKVVSKVGDAIVTDLIFAHDEADGVYENTAAGLRFTGRFAIVRTQESADGNELTLYIGAGQALSYQGHDLTATGNKGIRTVKLDQPLAAFANTESALYTPFGLRTSK